MIPEHSLQFGALKRLFNQEEIRVEETHVDPSADG